MASNSLVGDHGWKSAYNGNGCSPYISLCPDISQSSIGLSGKLILLPECLFDGHLGVISDAAVV